jgi:hypothetical protein
MKSRADVEAEAFDICVLDVQAEAFDITARKLGL